MRKIILRGALIALAVLPAAFALGVALHLGVDFHKGDEWDPEVAGIYIKAHQHQLTLGDLVSLHNEHRLLIPRLLYLLLNLFTRWNDIAEIGMAWVLACGTSVLMLYLMRRTSAQASWEGILGRWFLCNTFIFNATQGENFLTGWGMANMLPGLMTIGAIVVAMGGKPSWRRIAACMLLAAGASLSNGVGFMAWPLTGMVLAWSDSWEEFKSKQWPLVVWASGFVLVAGLYSVHYHGPPRLSAYDASLGKSLTFIATFLGNEFLHSTFLWQTACPVIGSVFLALLAASVICTFNCWRQGQKDLCRSLIVWLAVAGFALAAAVMGSISRAGYGPAQAIISRYVSFSLFLPVALINLLPIICDDWVRRKGAIWATRLPAYLAAGTLIMEIVGLPGSMLIDRAWQHDRIKGKGALLLLKLAPNNPTLESMVYHDVPKLIEEADVLNQMGFIHPALIDNNDAELIRDTDPADSSSVKGLLDVFQNADAGKVLVGGWAMLPLEKRAAETVFLTYDSPEGHPLIFAAAETELSREDIAQSMHDPNYKYSGWRFVLSRDLFPSSIQTLIIKGWVLNARTGKALPLDGSVTVGLR